MNAIIIIGVLVLLIIIYYYNSLIRRRKEVDNATGSINTMLKNRYDLIPNLVDVVKNYMIYEADTLTKLTSMRTRVLSSDTSDKEKIDLSNEISSAMRKIMVSVENYPELKTSNNLLQLQESWTDIEDKISASRRFYNNAVTEYNIAIKSFPGNLFAGMMNLKTKSIFEVSEKETQNLSAQNLFQQTKPLQR